MFSGDLELNPSNFLSIDSHGGILEIQEIQDLDAGDYTCVAVNYAGRASGQVTLDVGCKFIFIVASVASLFFFHMFLFAPSFILSPVLL